MKGSPYKAAPAEVLGGLQKWIAENAGDNAETLARLRRHLPRAIQEELTPRQRICLQGYYFDRKNMREIGEELGVNASTVSRTVARAENRLYRVLRYCL